MLEAIALYAPALIALRVYVSTRKSDTHSISRLVMSYGLFLVLINAVLYMVFTLLMGREIHGMNSEGLVEYLLGAVVLAIILPIVVRILETSVSIEIKRIGR